MFMAFFSEISESAEDAKEQAKKLIRSGVGHTFYSYCQLFR